MEARADPVSPLERYLAGELPAPVALMHLLIATRDAAAVAKLLDEAAYGQRQSADAIRELRSLLDRHPAAQHAIEVLMRSGLDHDRAGSPDDTLRHLRRAFDRAVAAAPEASVALYSLGSAALLAAAADEIVALLRVWGLLGPHRAVLDLGSGIGRIASALAPEVGSILGLDLSPAMVEEARRRCAGLRDVRFEVASGKDLAGVLDAGFDLVLAVDTFPYIVQAGLAAAMLRETARVLRPGGEAVILNWSYRGTPGEHIAEVQRLAGANRLEPIRAGARDLALWDGVSFRLSKPPQPSAG
jgi:SAM-dependent methyltransferase